MHEVDKFIEDEVEISPYGPDDLAHSTGNQRARTSARELPLGSHFFSHLIETIFDSVIVNDMDGNIVYANESAYLSRGYTREEFLQMKVCDLVIPTLSAICMERLKEVAGDRLTAFESIHLHKDGRHLHVEARGRLMELNGCKYYVAVLRNISARVAAERRLKKTEELLHSILEHAPMPIYSATIEGTFRLVNPAWEKVTGKQKNQVLGHSYEELFSAGTAAIFRGITRQVTATGEPTVYDEIMVFKGERRYFHTVIFPLWGDDGQVEAIGGISLDITERKRAEEDLQESETTLRTLNEANPESFFLLNTQGIILAASKVTAHRLGKNLEEIIGTSVYNHLAADVTQRRRAFIEEVVDTGRPVRFEDSRGGFHFDTYINPVFDLDGKVSKVAILGIDITARKHMDAALRESEEKYRLAIESAMAGVALIQDNLFHYVNPVIERILGYTQKELIGRLGPLDLLHPDDLPRITQEFHSFLKGEGPDVNVFKCLRKDGSVVICEVFARCIEFHGRNTVLAILMDITERKRIEESLKRLSKELEQRVAERTAELEAVKARMEYIIDTTPAIIFTAEVTPPYGVTFVSDQIRNLGYEPTEILGLNFFSLNRVHSDDLGKLLWAIDALFEDHQVMVKYRMLTKDGTYVWIQNNARLIINKSGVPVGIVACWTDISRQKELEQRLEILSGPTGKISVWKKASEVLGELAPTLLPQSWDRLQDILHAALQGETITGVSLQLYRKDGTFLDGLLTAGPLKKHMGDSFEAVGAIIELRHTKNSIH